MRMSESGRGSDARSLPGNSGRMTPIATSRRPRPRRVGPMRKARHRPSQPLPVPRNRFPPSPRARRRVPARVQVSTLLTIVSSAGCFLPGMPRALAACSVSVHIAWQPGKPILPASTLPRDLPGSTGHRSPVPNQLKHPEFSPNPSLVHRTPQHSRYSGTRRVTVFCTQQQG